MVPLDRLMMDSALPLTVRPHAIIAEDRRRVKPAEGVLQPRTVIHGKSSGARPNAASRTCTAPEIGLKMWYDADAVRDQIERTSTPETTMKRIALVLLACFISLPAMADDRPIRVLVWDEQQPEQKQAYGDKFLGETIAAYLTTLPGLSVRTANLGTAEQGLSCEALDETDVIVWWGHIRHRDVKDDLVDRVVERVVSGKLGLVALHSAHWAKPFVRLMQERAKADALKQIPLAERATAKLEFVNNNPIGVGVKRDSALTPRLDREGNGWRLTLPACVFPAWRADGAPSHVTTLLPDHPLARGLPKQWDVAHTEMYDEPFHISPPDAVVFEEKWDKGEHFRSGCLWQVGQGRVFYFRPGHETFAVYHNAEPLLVIENAVRWLGTPAASK